MERDYLAEAIRIARGETMLVPEREHVVALVKRVEELEFLVAMASQKLVSR
jgi:hypothetical protein